MNDMPIAGSIIIELYTVQVQGFEIFKVLPCHHFSFPSKNSVSCIKRVILFHSFSELEGNYPRSHGQEMNKPRIEPNTVSRLLQYSIFYNILLCS